MQQFQRRTCALTVGLVFRQREATGLRDLAGMGKDMAALLSCAKSPSSRKEKRRAFSVDGTLLMGVHAVSLVRNSSRSPPVPPHSHRPAVGMGRQYSLRVGWCLHP